MLPFLTLFATLSLNVLTSCEAVTVRTPVGSIAGFRSEVKIDNVPHNVTKFLSIPYAEPPIGIHRFRKPIAKAPFSGVFDASQPPVACFQASLDGESRYRDFANFSEDCLILNIYVPHAFDGRPKQLPVMVWIYGGAFVEGASARYEAEALAIRGDVIVVTINYRLGMFGFIRSADGQLPGNQGLWDQHMAIRWVHNNIGAFTGDPNTVTIFGESAGSASVFYQSLYAGNVGLFKRVIGQSGSSMSPWALVRDTNAEWFYKAKGCDAAPNPVGCLRALTPAQLQEDDTNMWRPMVDHEFLLDTPEELLFGTKGQHEAIRDLFRSLDIMTGVNQFDGGANLYYVGLLLNTTNMNTFMPNRQLFADTLLPIFLNTTFQLQNKDALSVMSKLADVEYTDWTQPDNSEALRMAFVEFSSDSAFFYPAIATVRAHSARKMAKTCFYQFSVNVSTHLLDTPSWLLGPNHADEIPYVFGWPIITDAPSVFPATDDEKAATHAIIDMWTNFAKSGDPNFPKNVTGYASQGFPAYDVTNQQYLDIGLRGGLVGDHFQARRMELWSHVLPALAAMIPAPCTQPDHMLPPGFVGK